MDSERDAVLWWSVLNYSGRGNQNGLQAEDS